MEQQRPLRLGDLVDDYCPRERRITNHAIVAIVEDAIRQTRCTACEADHVYKGGKAPLRKKPVKDEQAVLYDQVLANATAGTVVPAPAPAEAVAPVAVAASPAAPAPVAPVAVAAVSAPPEEPSPAPVVVDEGWSLNRRLIRASLPRVEGQSPVPRVIPEFTMHQRNVRGSQQFRGGRGNGNGYNASGNGNAWQDRSGNNGNSSNGHRGGFRSDGPGPGQGQGEGQPGAPNGQRPGAGRRRRRHKSPRPPQA
jgi:hypothetical protein